MKYNVKYQPPKNNKPEHRRYDVSDKLWDKLAPLLPERMGKGGRPSYDSRTFVDAVLWVLRTGAPWRDLPPDYGNWNSVAKRFRRWVKQGVWEGILLGCYDDEYEWLIIDASHIKVHFHGCGAMGGNQDMGRTKGGLIPKYTLPRPWSQALPVARVCSPRCAWSCRQSFCYSGYHK